MSTLDPSAAVAGREALARDIFDALESQTHDGIGITRASYGPGEQAAHDMRRHYEQLIDDLRMHYELLSTKPPAPPPPPPPDPISLSIPLPLPPPKFDAATQVRATVGMWARGGGDERRSSAPPPPPRARDAREAPPGSAPRPLAPRRSRQ